MATLCNSVGDLSLESSRALVVTETHDIGFLLRETIPKEQPQKGKLTASRVRQAALTRCQT